MISARRQRRSVVVVDQEEALVDGTLVTRQVPDELRECDPAVKAVYALYEQAAKSGRPVRAVGITGSDRVTFEVHPDGTVTSPRAVTAKRALLGTAALAAVAALGGALVLGGHTEQPREAASTTSASTPAAPSTPSPSAEPVVAPKPRPAREASASALARVGVVQLRIESTRRPTSARIRVIGPGGGQRLVKSVSLVDRTTTVSLKVRTAGRYRWTVRVTGVNPIVGAVRVPSPPRPSTDPPPAPTPPPVPAPAPQPEPAPEPAPAPPPSSGDGDHGTGGGQQHHGGPKPPPPLDGGGPPPVPTG